MSLQERLRTRGGRPDGFGLGPICDEAAAELDRLQARVAELEVDADYYVWRLQVILPIFQEARDALPAISLASAKLYRVDLSLGDRMDKAGTATRDDFDTARKAKP